MISDKLDRLIGWNSWMHSGVQKPRFLLLSTLAIAACGSGEIADTQSFAEMPDFPLSMTIPELEGCFAPVAKIDGPVPLKRVDGAVIRYTPSENETYRLSIGDTDIGDAKLAVTRAYVHFKEAGEQSDGKVGKIVDMSQQTYQQMKDVLPVFVERARGDETVRLLEYTGVAYQSTLAENGNTYALYGVIVWYIAGVDGIHSLTMVNLTPALRKLDGDTALAEYETTFAFSDRGIGFSTANAETFFDAITQATPEIDPENGLVVTHYGPVSCDPITPAFPPSRVESEPMVEPGRAITPATEAPVPAAPEQPPQIAIDKALHQRGEAITFSVSGLPGNNTDWVTLVPKNTAPEEWGSNWFYTQGVAEGDWSFWAPNAPGTYEIRVFFNYPDGGFEVQASTELIIAPAN